MWETCQDTLFSKRKEEKKKKKAFNKIRLPSHNPWNTMPAISSHVLPYWCQESHNTHYLRPYLSLVLQVLFNAHVSRLCSQRTDRPKIPCPKGTTVPVILERLCFLLVRTEFALAIINPNRISTKLPAELQNLCKQLHCWGYTAMQHLQKWASKIQKLLAFCFVGFLFNIGGLLYITTNLKYIGSHLHSKFCSISINLFLPVNSAYIDEQSKPLYAGTLIPAFLTLFLVE